MSEDNKIEIHEFTEQELALTEEEFLRSMARMAIDRMQLAAQNVPDAVIEAVTSFRYVHNTPYSVRLFTVNGVETACVVCEIAPGKVVLLSVINDECTVTDGQGTDLKELYAYRDKRKMN